MPQPGLADETGTDPVGVPGLDYILSGGLARNRIYLLDGNPGAGKTTLALQYLRQGAADGQRGLYITLSETRAELLSVMASHGWATDGFEIRDITVSEADMASESQVTMFHPSEVELSDTIQRITAAVDEVKPSRVVVDSLAELRLLSQNSLRYRRQVMALKQFFMGRRCTVVLLDDRTADGPDQQLQSIAHGVISLDQLAPEYGGERRRLRVLKYRGRAFRSGYHDYTIRKGGLEVFPRLVAAEHHASYTREAVPSGSAELDTLLGGGPHRGTSTLFMGPPGAGKTTVAAQYATAAAQRGERAAIYTFDENVDTLLARTEAVGIPLRREVERGMVIVQQVDPAELSPGEFAFRIKRTVEHDGVRLLLIDSLNGYQNSMPEEDFLVLHLHELFAYLGQQGVTTLITVAQKGLIGTMASPIDASYLADSIVLLRFFESAGRVRRAISVLKKRAGQHEDTIRELIIRDGGLVVGPPLTEFRGVLTGVPVVDPGRGREAEAEGG